MKITVNGEVRSVNQKLTLINLVETLSLNPNHLVVELNREVVQRDEFSNTELSDGDILELIEFVAGG